MGFDRKVKFLNVCTLIVLLFIGTNALAAEDSQSKDRDYFKKGDLIEISLDELKQKIKNRRNALSDFHLVDLRNEADYQKSFIPGAINVPFNKLSFLGEKLFSKFDKIILYGYNGMDPRSVNAFIQLKNKGFENCMVFTGGIKSWDSELETSVLNQAGGNK